MELESSIGSAFNTWQTHKTSPEKCLRRSGSKHSSTCQEAKSRPKSKRWVHLPGERSVSFSSLISIHHQTENSASCPFLLPFTHAIHNTLCVPFPRLRMWWPITSIAFCIAFLLFDCFPYWSNYQMHSFFSIWRNRSVSAPGKVLLTGGTSWHKRVTQISLAMCTRA